LQSCGKQGAALAALWFLLPAAALAQTSFEGRIQAQAATYRLRTAGPIQEHSSTFQGAALGVRFGGMRLEVEGLFGTVRSEDDGRLSLRATTLTIGLETPGVEVGVQALARHRATDESSSLLRLAGPYGTLRSDFGRGLSGQATLAWYPIVSAVNSDPLKIALRAEVGARYAIPNSPVSLFTSYRVLRLDYEPVFGANARLEQDAGMFLGVQFGRR
jgi:hypothetical protein